MHHTPSRTISMSSGRLRQAILTCFPVAILIVLSTPLIHAQCNDPSPTRPILLVHGFLGDSSDWGDPSVATSLRGSIISHTTSIAGYSNPHDYDLYFDGTAVKLSLGNPQTDPVASSVNIPCDARFFSIRFYSWSTPSTAFDPLLGAQISIVTKAYELSQVIKTITMTTFVKDVIVMAHSMGALVTRAYIEGLGSTFAPCTLASQPCPRVGSLQYKGDVGHLITIDGANAGGGRFASFGQTILSATNAPVLDVEELQSDSLIIEALNYKNSYNNVNAQALPPNLNIDAIITSYADQLVFCTLSFSLCGSDDVLTTDSQSIVLPLTGQAFSGLQDISNLYTGPDILLDSNCNLDHIAQFLHFLSCLGDLQQTRDLVAAHIDGNTSGALTQVTMRATLPNGQPYIGPISLMLSGNSNATAINSVPAVLTGPSAGLGVYTLSYLSGGPQGAQFSSITVTDENGSTTFSSSGVLQPGNWNLVFVVNFIQGPAFPPGVTTQPAVALQGDAATLVGSVNPNGQATTAWFEWGSSPDLSVFNATLPQPVGSGSTPQSINFSLGGLNSNTSYFFRAVANNTAGTVRGNPLSFTTLGTLPKPILQSPVNGAINISATPIFSWSPVTNASSYRLIVATSPAALPLDPTSSICGIGCVLNTTVTGTTFSAAAGILVSGITYSWEVHARSASQFGDWSAVSSFTTGPSLLNDFSLQVTPSTQAVNAGGTAAFGITTATTSGTAQSITFSAGNLPLGVTAIFTPNSLASGSTAVLGLATSPSTPPGNYSITVTAAGAFSTHSSIVTLVVNTTTGSPAATFSPASLSFSDQTQFTTGPSQLVNFINTGTAPLQVLSIVGDNNFAVLNPCINTLPPGTRCTFSVAFDPSTTGPMDGKAQLFFVGPTSPAVLPLHGVGLAPAPTTGTIQVNGTVNGNPLPNTPQFSFGFSYKLTGPSNLSAGGAETFTVLPGTYTISFSGSPAILTLSSVTPAATQNVAAGGMATFTMNFTAPTDFGIPVFEGPFPNQVVPAGAAATYTVGVDIPPGNVATPINIQVFGAPPGASISFSPQPLQSGGAYTLTISTSASTPPGAYTLSLSASDSTGLTRLGGNETALVVTQPPNQPAQLLSASSSLVQGNGDSSTTSAGGMSADGRYVVFSSGASNLVPNITSVHQDIFVRDQLLGSTALVSVASDGGLSNQDSFVPSISANGRFVVFQSSADNLVSGAGAVLGTNAVYVRDLQLGVTERDDISTSGVPGNAVGFNAAISADGRYVVFESAATNLVPGVTGIQVYLRDRKAQQTVLVSRGIDGLPANSRAFSPAISADGRFISFVSDAANLTGTAFTGIQVFVRDMQQGENILASVSNDGSPSSGGLFVQSSSPALSADGRFVLFTSQATNLVPSVTTDFFLRVYRRDIQQGTTALVDEDALAIPLGSPSGFPDPTISADGRFVAFAPFGQILVRDMANNQSAAVSLASDGTAGNDISQYAIISANGSRIGFTSKANNLVPNDVNGFADKFETANPLIGTPSARTISLASAAVGGGAQITGAISLSGPAPSSGATVLLSSNNSAAQVPSTMLVPAGQTAVSFPVSTSIVSQETQLTIVASYNGGSPFTILTLDPAPAFSISPSNWDFGNQAVGIASTATTFTISNAGTATLNLNSITLALGQVFTIAANTCGASLAPNLSCSVSVAFKPNSLNPASDFLQISFSSPQIVRSVPLLGNGAVPVVTLAPGVLNYSNHLVQSNTLAVATVTNVGNAALTGLTTKIAGTNASDFMIESDSCSGSVLQINNSCLITVGFSPKAIGSRTATLSLTDNAMSSPQSISLNGTGTDFSFTPPATGSTSQTITAGQTAIYNLQINSANGFSGQVALACSGAPALAQCAVNPTVIDINQSALPFTVTVKTSAPVTSAAAWRWSPHDPPILFCSILVAAGILYFVSLFKSQISRRAQIASVIFGILLITGCGGGGTGPTQNTGQPGTPRGTYTLIVNGTSGGQTRTLSLTLTVQ